MTRPATSPQSSWWQVLFRFGGQLRPTARLDERESALFNVLAEQWRRETAIQSSVENIILHPAYQRIIGMGPKALPLILRELGKAPEHWFWALWAISGEDPVSPEHAGKVKLMAEDWLALGRSRGWIH